MSLVRSGFRVIEVLTVAWVCAGCSEDEAPVEALPVIPPRVFSLVECWLSDSTSPVATEVNLDAARDNRNQFESDEIRRDGEWIRSIDEYGGRGFMRYRVVRRNGDTFVVRFQNNGGGTLTTEREIGFTLGRRTVVVDGAPRQIQVLRVTGFGRS